MTVTQARTALEAAKQNYGKCDHSEVTTAKQALDKARYAYYQACAELVTALEFKTSLDQVESELIAQGLWT